MLQKRSQDQFQAHSESTALVENLPRNDHETTRNCAGEMSSIAKILGRQVPHFFSFSSLQVIFESLLLKNTIQYCFQNSIKETKMLNQIFIVASSEREQVYTR